MKSFLVKMEYQREDTGQRKNYKSSTQFTVMAYHVEDVIVNRLSSEFREGSGITVTFLSIEPIDITSGT